MCVSLRVPLGATENLEHLQPGNSSSYITFDNIRDLTEVTGPILYAHYRLGGWFYVIIGGVMLIE